MTPNWWDRKIKEDRTWGLVLIYATPMYLLVFAVIVFEVWQFIVWLLS